MNDQRKIKYLDVKKRRTLQVLCGAGLATGIVSTGPTLSRALNTIDTRHRESNDTDVVDKTRGELDMVLINSPDVVENPLIINNTSQDDIVIGSFIGGAIVFKDKYMNSAPLPQPICVKALNSIALKVDVLQLIAHPRPMTSYVWADDATTTLENGTHLVSLGAFMADDTAILFSRAVA